MPQVSGLQYILDTLPQQGRVDWIGIRPARREPMQVVSNVTIELAVGIIGDRFKGRRDSKRQVTLIQAEHIQAIAGYLQRPSLDPALLRRNILVSGINLLALKGKQFSIGTTILEFTGLCHPCSRMEEVLGAGGYNAVRGHGGITAKVIRTGNAAVGDVVSYLEEGN